MQRSHLRPSMTQKISGPDGHDSGVEAFIRDGVFPTEGWSRAIRHEADSADLGWWNGV
jgi:hypothetical protein